MYERLFVGYIVTTILFVSIGFWLGVLSGYQEGFYKGYHKMRKELSKEKTYKEVKRESLHTKRMPPMDDKSQSLAELLIARGYVQADDLKRVALVISQAQAAPKGIDVDPCIGCHLCENGFASTCAKKEIHDMRQEAPKAESVQSAEDLLRKLWAEFKYPSDYKWIDSIELIKSAFYTQRQAGREKRMDEEPDPLRQALGDIAALEEAARKLRAFCGTLPAKDHLEVAVFIGQFDAAMARLDNGRKG